MRIALGWSSEGRGDGGCVPCLGSVSSIRVLVALTAVTQDDTSELVKSAWTHSELFLYLYVSFPQI